MSEPLTLTDDEFDATSAIWNLIQDAGHLHCGGWSWDSRDTPGTVTCACGGAVMVPVYADRGTS